MRQIHTNSLTIDIQLPPQETSCSIMLERLGGWQDIYTLKSPFCSLSTPFYQPGCPSDLTPNAHKTVNGKCKYLHLSDKMFFLLSPPFDCIFIVCGNSVCILVVLLVNSPQGFRDVHSGVKWGCFLDFFFSFCNQQVA